MLLIPANHKKAFMRTLPGFRVMEKLFRGVLAWKEADWLWFAERRGNAYDTCKPQEKAFDEKTSRWAHTAVRQKGCLPLPVSLMETGSNGDSSRLAAAYKIPKPEEGPPNALAPSFVPTDRNPPSFVPVAAYGNPIPPAL